GCSAAALTASGHVRHLHLVDPNPAQLALARLKLRLLGTATTVERLALLGHQAMAPVERRRRLGAELAELGLAPWSLGPVDQVAQVGPDHAGRYERVFVQLREELRSCWQDWVAVLELSDFADQQRRMGAGTELAKAFDAAFERALALGYLVHLFGEEA